MDFGWADAAAVGANAIGGALSKPNDQALSNLHLVNPAQQALYNSMAGKLMGGGGDFGFGTAFKQGKSQLQDMMAQRGISSDSGIGMQQMGNMTAGALGQDAANRRDTWFQLMGVPLQTAQTSGANFIPGSPSSGTGRDQQSYNLTNRENMYGRYASPWNAYDPVHS